MRTLLYVGLAGLALCAVGLADQGVVVKNAEVRAAPKSDAAALGELLPSAPVEIVERQGAWLSVRSPPLEGWVRLLSVRPVASTAAPDATGVKAALNVARSGTTGAAVATGVRGLDPAQLRNAAPNAAELQKLQAYQCDRGDAEFFAYDGTPALSSAAVAYVDANGKPVKTEQKKAR
jgi:hypothetical protein